MEESLGIIYRDAGYPGMGVPRLEKAVQIATKLLDNPNDEFIKKSAERSLGLYYRRLAQLNREVGNDDEAEVMEMLANEFGLTISSSKSR
jgi:SpoVK/Ycf46/Vps4 family AAA+-type ATPase